MDDLIDRAALIAEYEYLKAECYESSWDAWDDIIDRVKKQPRVAADLVRHAYWIDASDEYNNGNIVYRCSYCREDKVLIDGTPETNNLNYCPICGAKMDAMMLKMAEQQKLLPCPFCGGKAEIILDVDEGGDSIQRVECQFCYVQTDGCYSKDEAMRLWNRRCNNDV